MANDKISDMPPSDADIRPDLAAVVPCYNVGGLFRPVLDRLLTVLDRVVVVDDGSTDGLADTIKGLPVRLIRFPVNRGKGHALIEGLRAAREFPGIKAVVTVDSDGQHDPGEIPNLYQTWRRTQADLVIGSRIFDKGVAPLRSRVGNKTTILITSLLFGKRLPDTQSGFRVHSIRFVDHILQTVVGGRYETEMEILVRAFQDGFLVEPATIQTIYEPGNRSSHFSSLRDSFLIYRRMIRLALRGSRRVPQKPAP